MKIRTIFLFVISLSVFLHTTPRYVKAGNPTPVPPFLTWATASDSIQKCINISQPGDTIFVGAGTYKEEAHMTRGLALIGAGWDSTIIDTRDLNPQSSRGTVQMDNNCYICGFRIIVSSSMKGYGIRVDKYNTYMFCKIENIFIENSAHGIYIDYSDAQVLGTIVRNSLVGVRVLNADAKIENCVFNNTTEYAISPDIESITKIRNNIIQIGNGNYPTGGSMGFTQSNTYQNNIFIVNNTNGRGIDAWVDDTLKNNLIYGNYYRGINTYAGIDIRNNSVTGAQYGIANASASQPLLRYNNVWNCTVPYPNLIVDTTNISANPMYVNPGSADFHLQAYSPLINRGDPSLLDQDGSRSDIGGYGGPFGQSYVYQDLPPAVPVNITASVDSGRILLIWNKNTEADFSHYIIYRDTVSGFTPDSTRIIGDAILPRFYDPLLPIYKKLYYKIIAVDNQGLQSEPSSEIPVIINGTDNLQFPDNYTYKLYQNFPNPFNSSTTIQFRIQKQGRAALQLYTINGELLATLQNREYEPGYYEQKLDFQSIGKSLSSGFYLISLMAYDSRATVVFTDIIKIIYLK